MKIKHYKRSRFAIKFQLFLNALPAAVLVYPSLRREISSQTTMEVFGPRSAYKVTSDGVDLRPFQPAVVDVQGDWRWNFMSSSLKHTALSLLGARLAGGATPHKRVLIIRGIGFRASVLENPWATYDGLPKTSTSSLLEFSSLNNLVVRDHDDSTDWEEVGKQEFTHARYLSVRVGHSFHLVVPIPNQIGVRVLKKDRKLVIYGSSKILVADFARKLHEYHRPSVYTGRGVRYKKGLVRRKLGKKDVRKGRRF